MRVMHAREAEILGANIPDEATRARVAAAFATMYEELNPGRVARKFDRDAFLEAVERAVANDWEVTVTHPTLAEN